MRNEMDALQTKIEEEKVVEKQFRNAFETQMAVVRRLKRTHSDMAVRFKNADTGASSDRFVQACAHPGCGGYLSRDWNCLRCKKRTCANCVEPVTGAFEDHTCCPETRVAVETMKNDATRCPGCGAYVNRVNGCGASAPRHFLARTLSLHLRAL